jgi:ATP-dependent DNA helicase DinG
LRRKLLDTHDTMVFTSATLSAGGTFDYFRHRMGMSKRDDEGPLSEDYRIEEVLLPSVFDYEDQCVVYVPRRLPEPKHPEYMDGFCTIVDYLLGLTDGRAFLLFTSYRNMEEAWDRLHDELPFDVMKQGDAPKRELLDRFREADAPVLFATQSFWEGVDVVGDKLSMVVIDKLPFANPSDPLVRARLDLIDGQGGNAFAEFSLPQAALSLKQGFGRLIRSREDRGVVAILDSRIAHKRYGSYFLESLPPAPVVWRAAGVRDWWKEHASPGQV